MIWRQFVACQMPPAQYTSTTVIAEAGDFELRIRGRMCFDGFTRVLPAVMRKRRRSVVAGLRRRRSARSRQTRSASARQTATAVR
jgi:DNA topoisomerase-1